jgi:dienelactone hydrolase
MLLASEDTVARYERCKDAVHESATPNLVKIVIYPDAIHCFDMSELPPRTYYEFGTIGYHPQAAAAAWEEIQRFLQPAK